MNDGRARALYDSHLYDLKHFRWHARSNNDPSRITSARDGYNRSVGHSSIDYLQFSSSSVRYEKSYRDGGKEGRGGENGFAIVISLYRLSENSFSRFRSEMLLLRLISLFVSFYVILRLANNSLESTGSFTSAP